MALLESPYNWVGFSSPKKTTNHQGSTGHCSHSNKQQLKLVPGRIFVGNLAGFYRWTLRVQDDDAEVRHDWRAVVKQQRHRRENTVDDVMPIDL